MKSALSPPLYASFANSEDVQPLIVAAIEALADDPRPTGCKKLKGDTALYRIRAATTYRVVYEIQDRQLLITVVKIGHRRDIYR